MGKLMNILPISDLRQDAANVLKKLRDNKEPIIITQRGRAAAVIIGVEAYAACGTFLDMLITYFSIVLICFLLQFFELCG